MQKHDDKRENERGGGKKMDATVGEKTMSLDFSKLRFAKEPMTSADALRDVIPMPWSDDVRNGKTSVIYSCPRKEREKVEDKNVQKG